MKGSQGADDVASAPGHLREDTEAREWKWRKTSSGCCNADEDEIGVTLKKVQVEFTYAQEVCQYQPQGPQLARVAGLTNRVLNDTSKLLVSITSV